MLDMSDRQMTLPLPEPGNWMTIMAVAHLLGVNRKTVDRWIEKGTLKAYAPYAAPDERPQQMIWRDHALSLLGARKRLSGAGQ